VTRPGPARLPFLYFRPGTGPCSALIDTLHKSCARHAFRWKTKAFLDASPPQRTSHKCCQVLVIWRNQDDNIGQSIIQRRLIGHVINSCKYVVWMTSSGRGGLKMCVVRQFSSSEAAHLRTYTRNIESMLTHFQVLSTQFFLFQFRVFLPWFFWRCCVSSSSTFQSYTVFGESTPLY